MMTSWYRTVLWATLLIALMMLSGTQFVSFNMLRGHLTSNIPAAITRNYFSRVTYSGIGSVVEFICDIGLAVAYKTWAQLCWDLLQTESTTVVRSLKTVCDCQWLYSHDHTRHHDDLDNVCFLQYGGAKTRVIARPSCDSYHYSHDLSCKSATSHTKLTEELRF